MSDIQYLDYQGLLRYHELIDAKKIDKSNISTTAPSSSSTDTTIPTSKAVYETIKTLDGNLNNTTPGAGKTLTAFSQTDGKVSATFGNISITKSQISDFPTIPTVNDGTFSVKTKVGTANAVTAADFTANQSGTDDITFILGDNVTLTTNATNRTITIAATDTTYESKAAAANGTALSLVTTGEKAAWNAKTSNTGTVTTISTGAGLTGGDITTTGTIKANLTSETKLTNSAADGTETSGRVYPVRLDKDGKLAVNVPWEDKATLKVSDTTNKKISTEESSENYIQFTAGTNKFTVSDGTSSFDVAITPSISKNATATGTLTSGVIITGGGSYKVASSGKTITTTLGADDTTVPTSKAVATAISNATAGLTGAMHFIGISTTAITDGGTETPTIANYEGTAKTEGNVVLYGQKEFVWTGSAWEELGNEGSYALSTIKVEGTGVLGGGGTLTENREITHNTSGVTAGTYGPSEDITGSNNTTISVPEITVDSYGHITSVTNRTYTSLDSTYTVNNGTFSVKTKVGDNAAVTAADFTANLSGTDDVTFILGTNVTLTTNTSNRTITIAATDTTYDEASTSTAGLMSAADKTKLNGIATGATANVGTITGIKMNGSSKGTSGVVDLGTVITDVSGKADKSATVSTITYDTTNKKLTKTINGTTSDIVTVSTIKTDLNLTSSDVGLGNVGNFKAVSTVASQGLTPTEQSNARANIGAGTSSFSGSYNDLTNKPSIPAAASDGTFSIKTKIGSASAVTVSDFTANQSSADDVTFIQGDNVTLTSNTTNRTITIGASMPIISYGTIGSITLDSTKQIDSLFITA